MKYLVIVFVVLCIISSGFTYDGYYGNDYSWDWHPKDYNDNKDYFLNSWGKKLKYNSNGEEIEFYNDVPNYSGNDNENYYYASKSPPWDYDYIHGYRHKPDRECITPNGERARCITINNCPILQKHSYNYYHRSRFFKESVCGHSYSELLVCCGSEYKYNKNHNLPSFPLPSLDILPPTIRPTVNPVIRSGATLPSTTTPLSTITSSISSTSLSPTSELGLRSHTNFNLLPSRNTCGLQGLDDKIFGGTESGLSEFPWMTLLEYQLNGISTGHKCGGMLINDRYILTAAHCVFGKTLPLGQTLLGVRLGEHDINSNIDCRMGEDNIEDCNQPPQDIRVEEIIVHPGFNDSNVDMINDIALLRLREVPKQNDFVRPICLPIGGERSLPGDNLTIAGWGLTETEAASDIKLKAPIPYIDDNQCKEIWSRARAISDNQFCAGGSGQVGACTGDSGGPIMFLAPGTINWFAEGIISFGRLPCGTFPTVFTRISSYINWILDNIKP